MFFPPPFSALHCPASYPFCPSVFTSLSPAPDHRDQVRWLKCQRHLTRLILQFTVHQRWFVNVKSSTGLKPDLNSGGDECVVLLLFITSCFWPATQAAFKTFTLHYIFFRLIMTSYCKSLSKTHWNFDSYFTHGHFRASKTIRIHHNQQAAYTHTHVRFARPETSTEYGVKEKQDTKMKSKRKKKRGSSKLKH